MARFNTRIRVGTSVVQVHGHDGRITHAKVAASKGKSLVLHSKGDGPKGFRLHHGSGSRGGIKAICFRDDAESGEERAMKALINKVRKAVA